MLCDQRFDKAEAGVQDLVLDAEMHQGRLSGGSDTCYEH